MEKITVRPDDIWNYFLKHESELTDIERLVAENPVYGTAIYITNDRGLMTLIVYMDDDRVQREKCVSEHDAKVTTEKLYENYLTSRAVDAAIEQTRKEEKDDELLNDQDRMIEDREYELDDVFYTVLQVVLGDDFYPLGAEFDEIADDLKEHVCEYLARKYGAEIFRPMYLEDDDGEEFFEEYPYECMEFDDDNPIYDPV